jgi:hypothetical protein
MSQPEESQEKTSKTDDILLKPILKDLDDLRELEDAARHRRVAALDGDPGGTMTVEWGDVTQAEVVRAIGEYDRLGPEDFFSRHGFGPTTTYDLIWDERRYPPKAILGVAYEFATGQRLASGDFEGGRTGAVRVLGNLGFTIRPRRP